MTASIKIFGLLFLCVFSVSGCGLQDECDFSKYRSTRQSHFVERNALKKVEPKYPDEAKRRGIAGRVFVRILVNKDGKVEVACPVINPDSSKEPLLVKAAVEAAKQWEFKKDFGYPSTPKLKNVPYRDTTLEFIFDLPKTSKRSDSANLRNGVPAPKTS